MSLSPNNQRIDVGCCYRFYPSKQQRDIATTNFATIFWYHGCPHLISWLYVCLIEEGPLYDINLLPWSCFSNHVFLGDLRTKVCKTIIKQVNIGFGSKFSYLFLFISSLRIFAWIFAFSEKDSSFAA
jgi:hypothetical protein